MPLEHAEASIIIFLLSEKYKCYRKEERAAFLRRAATGEPEGGLWPFLYEAIPHSLRNRVGRLSIQSLVEEIQKSPKHQDWIGEFKAKYGLK